MSYMSSTAMQGKNIVGSPSGAIMPSERMFRGLTEEANPSRLVQVGEKVLDVPVAYSAGPEVMDRRK